MKSMIADAGLELGSAGLPVRWNGAEVATLWHPPHRVDLAAELLRETNALEIQVVTTLWNWCRTLTDNEPVMYWIRWSNWHQPLGPIRDREPSGLVGPVVLES